MKIKVMCCVARAIPHCLALDCQNVANGRYIGLMRAQHAANRYISNVFVWVQRWGLSFLLFFLSTIGIVVVSSFRISILLNSPDTMPFNQETQFSHRRFYCMRRSQSTIGSFHRSIHVRSQTRLQYRGDNLVLKVKVKMCSHCLHMCRK